MSKYTTQLRFICETLSGLDESEGYNKTKDIIEAARPLIFDFEYPIFDVNYKKILETNIIRHYYTREICAETLGLWKLWLESDMIIKMGYFNQLYKSATLDFNPFYDVDLTRTHKLQKHQKTEHEGKSTLDENVTIDESQDGEVTSNSNVHNTSTASNDQSTDETKEKIDKYSETPEGSLDSLIAGTYLTNARIDNDKIIGTNKTLATANDDANSDSITESTNESTTRSNRDSSTNTENTNNIESLDDFLETVKGKNGGKSYSTLLTEYRSTFLNIDEQVINSLATLFFGLLN